MANFTKKAIVYSFYNLLQKKHLNQITVKDIVTDCGVNRNSFYYYFEDIPSLLTEQIDFLCEKIMANYSEHSSIEDWLIYVLSLAKENRKILNNCLSYIERSTYEKYMTKVFGYIISKYIEKTAEAKSVSDDDREIIVRFFIYQYTGFFLDWFKNGMSDDISRLISRTSYLQDGILEMMISKASSQNIEKNT
ncbi:MAG: TetR family transcriptional regulator C-terminal domain-containing protein [Clostridia bacterium]|nr:TetR family transcriptional regulator C-terminal domain-containing protein [Clostridia bacterium]